MPHTCQCPSLLFRSRYFSPDLRRAGRLEKDILEVAGTRTQKPTPNNMSHVVYGLWPVAYGAPCGGSERYARSAVPLEKTARSAVPLEKTTFWGKNDTQWRSAAPWPAGPRAMPACPARLHAAARARGQHA
eukprot:2109488-Prymnesium_polylepis.1